MGICPKLGQIHVLIRDVVLFSDSRWKPGLGFLRQALDGIDQTGNIAGFGEAMIAAL